MNTMMRHLGRTVLLGLLLAGGLPGQYLAEAWRTQFPAVTSGVLRGYETSGDFDGNGTPDIVFADGIWNQFFYLPNPALNGITNPSVYYTANVGSPGPNGVLGGHATRIDTDPYLDLVIALGDSLKQIYVYPGDGSGNFPQVPWGPLPLTQYYSSWLADFDNDGRGDLVVQRNPVFPGSIELVALSNSHPSWNISWAISLTYVISFLVTGDFDGDGNSDIAWISLPDTMNYPSSVRESIFVGFGAGNGTFQGPMTFNVGVPMTGAGNSPGQVDLVTGDFNGDGRQDLATVIWRIGALAPNDDVRVFHGNANRTFSPGAILNIGKRLGYECHAGDFDDDGLTDILVQDDQTYAAGTNPSIGLQLFRGLGSGVFSPTPMETLTSPVPFGHIIESVVDDFDGDGDLDILGVPSPTWTFYFENRAIFGDGCTGTLGLIPRTTIGSPDINNPTFAMGVFNALPQTAAALAVSLTPAPPSTQPCPINLDFAGPWMLFPAQTDLLGRSSLTLPIPNDPTLHGVSLFAQWGILDPQGALGPPPYLALSRGRTVILW